MRHGDGSNDDDRPSTPEVEATDTGSPQEGPRFIVASTAVHAVDGAVQPGPTFAQVFARIYPRLAALHASFNKDGVLLAAALDGQALVGHAHLRLTDGPGQGVLGRHRLCDLQLAEDPAISLRHALVRASRGKSGDLRLRVVDLDSRSGLRTEDGLPCEALVCEGPLFLRAGRYHLFFLPTGALSPIPWSERADQTWAAFPERVYLDRRVPERLPRPIAGVTGRPLEKGAGPGGAAGSGAVAERSAASKKDPDADGDSPSGISSGKSRISQVTLLPPAQPLRARPAKGSGEQPPIATLTLAQKSERVTYPVHADELERGVLVGRYERCQLGGADRALSRIHVLIVQEEDGVWALDTASTNGMTQEGHDVRQVQLPTKAPLLLADKIELQWEPRRGATA